MIEFLTPFFYMIAIVFAALVSVSFLGLISMVFIIFFLRFTAWVAAKLSPEAAKRFTELEKRHDVLREHLRVSNK